MVFPGPLNTFKGLFVLLGHSYTWKCLYATFVRMITGFAASFLIAMMLGVIAGNYPFIRGILAPFFSALQSIPTASFIYLFIVLAGFRRAPVLMVAVISLPIIYQGIAGGIANIPQDIEDAMKIDGADFVAANLQVRLPLAYPYIAVALASSFSLCFKIEIMAEVITGSSVPGLGTAIAAARANDPTDMVPVMAYSLIAVAFVLAIDRLSSFIKDKIRSV